MKWWRHIVAMELRKILAYRSDFWITFLGQTLIQLFVARSLWETIFATQGVQEMQGYTLEMMSLYYLIVPIGTRMLTGENIGFVAREIYDGTFTRYLLYPLSVFQYKTLTYLTYSLFYGIQLILLYSLYHLIFIRSPFTSIDFQNLLMGVGLFFFASITFVMMAFCIELISLWADNIWTLRIMLQFLISFFGGGFIPLSFLPNWLFEILKWTPLPYLISLPTRTILGLTSLAEINHGLLLLSFWMILFMCIVKMIWKKGELEYTGVGV
jgi:ABC-2 type transport system permease protein